MKSFDVPGHIIIIGVITVRDTDLPITVFLLICRIRVFFIDLPTFPHRILSDLRDRKVSFAPALHTDVPRHFSREGQN